MATRHTPSQSLTSKGPALFGLALLMLFGDLLQETAVQSSHLLCTIAGELLKILPSVILVICHALETYVLDYERLFVCFQMFASFWTLLRFLVGAA